MKLIKHSDNANEIIFNTGNTVLFSYETPVAVSLADKVTVINPDGVELHYVGVYKTNAKFSKTTSRHINEWTNTTKVLPQDELERLVNHTSFVSSR